MNSKQRRALRRLLKEAGLLSRQPSAETIEQEHTEPKPLQLPPRAGLRNWYKHLWLGWKILIFAFGVPSLFIGIVSMRPRVLVEPGEPLHANDPMSFPVLVTNDGQLTLHDVRVHCKEREIVDANGNRLANNRVEVRPDRLLIGSLTAGGHATVYCSGDPVTGIDLGPQEVASADAEIVVSFRPDFFPWHRQDTFRLHGGISDDKRIHWAVSP